MSAAAQLVRRACHGGWLNSGRTSVLAMSGQLWRSLALVQYSPDPKA
jgi:hypothetical protein